MPNTVPQIPTKTSVKTRSINSEATTKTVAWHTSKLRGILPITKPQEWNPETEAGTQSASRVSSSSASCHFFIFFLTFFLSSKCKLKQGKALAAVSRLLSVQGFLISIVRFHKGMTRATSSPSHPTLETPDKGCLERFLGSPEGISVSVIWWGGALLNILRCTGGISNRLLQTQTQECWGWEHPSVQHRASSLDKKNVFLYQIA